MRTDLLTHRQKWDGFWRGVATTERAAIWDVDPDVDIASGLPLDTGVFDPALPLIDLGCGNGRQTAYFAGWFDFVVGIDISAEAIRGAREIHEAPNVEYCVLDAGAVDQAFCLHEELGDANVHVHELFHQLPAGHRDAVAASVAELAGERGRVLVVEAGPGSAEVFEQLLIFDGPPPPKMARVFDHGIRPGELDDGEVVHLFAGHGFRLLRSGSLSLGSTVQLSDGAPFTVPGEFWLFGRDA
ncbi:class I SAM-dependent methyltransferase [Pseudonocardia sp. GCM10023141]|uniref:class I SAM-dependent methyltransferase n=1 Tax=Pseudonocardia sp. GCM10023141 TaxID=3252653 RepID=UPI0036118002